VPEVGLLPRSEPASRILHDGRPIGQLRIEGDLLAVFGHGLDVLEHLNLISL